MIKTHLEIIKDHLIAQESVSPLQIVEEMEKHIDKYMKSYTMEDPDTNMKIQVVVATMGSYSETITTITEQDIKYSDGRYFDTQVCGGEAKYFTTEGKHLLDIVIGNLIYLQEALNGVK